MRRSVLSLLLMLVAPLAWADKPTAPQSIDGARTVTAEEAVTLILNEPTLVIIDSRKDKEYSKGHIEGAVSLLDTLMTADKLAKYAATKNTPLLFYCNGSRCLRSSNAVSKALRWGYSNLYWFRGGWVEWRDKKLPIAK